MISYSFGNFTLHDGQTYFVTKIDGISPLDLNITTAKIGRTEGLKKIGQSVDMRTITVAMTVIAPDRATLIAKLDALVAALAIPQQTLVLHPDGRYFVADCVKCTFPVDAVGSAQVQLQFNCYQPYAYAPYQNQATLQGTATPSLFNWQLTGGGTIFSHPTIIVQNIDPVSTLSNIAVLNTTANTQLAFPSGFTLAHGEYFTAVSDPFQPNGYTVTKNGNTSVYYDFLGTFPTLDVGTTSWQFQALANNAAFQIQMIWTPRYL